MSGKIKKKPDIFEEQISRKPDHYPWAKEFIRSMWEGHWTDQEFSFASDKHDFYTKVSQQERETIIRSLSAISQVELPVKQRWGLLGQDLPHPSFIDLGFVFASIEVIHAEAYFRLIEELDLEDAFVKNLELDCMKGRINYLRKHAHRYYSNSKKNFVYSLILFTLFVENVSLFSQFYVINWFGRKNLLKDTCVQVSYTSKEEQIHALAGIKIINTIREEHPELFDDEMKERVLYETQEAFNAESKIVDWIVNGIETEYLSADILKEFIKNRLNESLESIFYPKMFEVNKDLLKKTEWFDEVVFGNNSEDFFFQRPTAYSRNNQSFAAEELF